MNNGLGPAIIENFVVKIDEVQIPGVGAEPMEKAIARLFAARYVYDLESSFITKNYSMPSLQ